MTPLKELLTSYPAHCGGGAQDVSGIQADDWRALLFMAGFPPTACGND